jgi:hypothetical protein
MSNAPIKIMNTLVPNKIILLSLDPALPMIGVTIAAPPIKFKIFERTYTNPEEAPS